MIPLTSYKGLSQPYEEEIEQYLETNGDNGIIILYPKISF